VSLSVVGIGIVALLTHVLIFGESKTNYEAPEPITVEEVAIVEQDILDKAKADLERINAELDAEEAELLKQREVIDLRLEDLRKTRSSF